MTTVRSFSELPRDPRPVCVALGMFDGVHLGHQHVIRQAVLDARALHARSAAVTFHPHPLFIVRPDRAPKLLQPISQRLEAIAALGTDLTLALEFDRELSQQTGESFVRNLITGFGAMRSITVGEGFHFGRQRSGNVELLQSLGKELGFTVNAMAPIRIGDEIVSSTRIRATLREGDLGHASELLGRSYSLAGKVIRGDQLGRQLGFPTANIDVEGLELPPHGVYATRVIHSQGESLGALNIGVRPTVGAGTSLRFEVHLLDFAGDLYDQTIKVEFIRRIRTEQRFPSVEALKEQISADVVAVRSVAN
ncbi:MAG TPA: bifunctional riboflavin kinase/FAD synthetase [Candidatus Limnocylindria bacterium]|jgi:riboflavin kinase/FMN adenylyltransferase|nr:bifunctional riboflavin kinase/FAD synthetase [Candidatus Limnocylindria bacterium]